MLTFKLNNGTDIPALGYGVFQINDPDQCTQCVVDAIGSGYRLIDTAAAYGNEESVGQGIKLAGVPREELFIATKVWVSDTGYDKTMYSFERSMKYMDLDYLDMLMLHRPFGDYYGSWKAMEELHRQSVLRSLGVCNFTMDRLVDLCYHTEIPPAINQIETHIFHQQNSIRPVMEDLGVRHQAWAPFAEGKFGIFTNDILASIGRKYGKTPGQIMLRWQIQRGTVVIPKSLRKSRMEENFNIWDFELTDGDMARITALDTNTSIFGDDTLNSYEQLKKWNTITVKDMVGKD